ncbi:hypothetical protein SteCoe_32246 [Stentor coeruleus]|uniref:Uncharacterized protein n=1 Tax=Stentor coeruleus TaxID=5963 RepID=A0A1R2AZU9_9CILI|nr:hypothetical protein SteCoe_32246 [Stentor coeruleus]
MDSLIKYEPTKSSYSQSDSFGSLTLFLSKRPDKNKHLTCISTSKSRFFAVKPYQNSKTQAFKIHSFARLRQNAIQPLENFHRKSETETIKLGPYEPESFTIKKGKNVRKPSKKTSEIVQENADSKKISFDAEENNDILNYISNKTTKENSKDLKNHRKYSSMPLKHLNISDLIIENPISAFSNKKCQTDFKTPDLKHIENTSNIDFKNYKNQCLNKALVTAYNIDISLKVYQIKYFINSVLDIIYIDVSAYNEKYDMKYNIKPGSPILEIIKNKIHRGIDIVNKELVIRDCEKNILMAGMHISKMIKYKVCVESTSPRYEVIFTCEIMGKCIKKTLSFSEIPQEYQTTIIDPEILFTICRLKENTIFIEFPQKKNLQTIYYKHRTFNNQIYYLKISEFFRKNSRFFLFQTINKDLNPVGSLLINTYDISEITNIPNDNLLERIRKIVSLLTIKDSQIILRNYIETKKTLSNGVDDRIKNEMSFDKFKTFR